MAVYRANFVQIQPTATGGMVNFDCFVQLRVSNNPAVWQDTAQGHFTLQVPAASILAITDSTMTAVQKRQALRDMLKPMVLAMGIEVSDEAYADFLQLLPPPFDVTIRDVVA